MEGEASDWRCKHPSGFLRSKATEGVSFRQLFEDRGARTEDWGRVQAFFPGDGTFLHRDCVTNGVKRQNVCARWTRGSG